MLRDNYEQTQAISAPPLRRRTSMADVQARFMRQLEQKGRLDRALEFLPDDETLTERKAAGARADSHPSSRSSLVHEVSLYEELLASDLPDDPYMADELERYFPTACPPAVPHAAGSPHPAPRDHRHRR